MTVGKLSLACWIVFGVMSAAFLPLFAGIFYGLDGLPNVVRGVTAAVVVVVAWWGPFVYGMYLSMAVMRNGDRRLLRRGIRGTAVVLAAKRTNTVIQSGEFEWEAPRVYKYRLNVTLPGKAPYQTDCSICAPGIREGSTVTVVASPRNRKRVTIDVGQGQPRVKGASRPAMADAIRAANATAPSDRSTANADRIEQLTRLAKLHREGALTDAEFAAEKARVLRG